jgi:ubiquinone/menaquinone biosynthesis C-methylase UbiE
VELADFIAQHAPLPARVLEIGCGGGELARALDDAGYEVTAIDPAAPDGPIFRKIKLEELEEDGDPFDLVIASRSLHHVTNLDGALAKVTRLLRPGGVLVIEEFAWNRLDTATAEWFLDQRRILAAGRASVPASLEECCREWEEEHVGLHGYEAMRAALDACFDELYFEWRPYLHRLLDGGADAAAEQALVDAGTVQATAFRYVGRPRSKE